MTGRFNWGYVMNVYEMEGFLRGKCLPGDLLVGESTAAYLVRKLKEAATLKTDRDAQQKRADALAVENAGLKAISIKLFNLGYLHGHESTVEGYFVDVHRNDIDTYHDDVVAEIIEDEDETPATDAALAAIEARGAIAAIESLIGKKKRSLAEMHPDTHAFGATAEAMRTQITWLQAFAIELREVK